MVPKEPPRRSGSSSRAPGRPSEGTDACDLPSETNKVSVSKVGMQHCWQRRPRKGQGNSGEAEASHLPKAWHVGLTIIRNKVEGPGDLNSDVKRGNSIRGSQEPLGVLDRILQCLKLHFRKIDMVAGMGWVVEIELQAEKTIRGLHSINNPGKR